MKRFNLIFLLTMLLFSITIASANGPVNLINDNTTIQQDTNATFEDGVFAMTSIQDEYLASFNVPGLTNSYTWSGDVTVVDIDESVEYSGVRFCIGYDTDSGNYINLLITRTMGVSADQRGTTPVPDVYPVSNATFNKTLTDEMTFHFEIVRDNDHVILKVDNATVIDYKLPEEYNLFTEGDDLNLGFYTCKCSYEVRNLAVYDEDVEITPVPSPSPEPTPSPTPVKTEAPAKTDIPPVTEEKGDGTSPIIIVISVVALLFLVFTIVIIISVNKK